MRTTARTFGDWRTALPGIALRCVAIGFPLLAPLAPAIPPESPEDASRRAAVEAARAKAEEKALHASAAARALRLRSFRLCHALTVEENARRWFEVAGG